ncbi:MAG: hypothetical protein KBS54_06980 [Synergistaceae bacterium]|nr:hypothetical protein [Candidatus Equadaptatus faecalis]
MFVICVIVFIVLVCWLPKTLGKLNERKAKDRGRLDYLKMRGVVLKISNVERRNYDLYVYDENYGEIWSCRGGDLSWGEMRSCPSTKDGAYEYPRFIDFCWDEDSVTLRFKCVGHYGNSDRYFVKKFNAYKETISWHEV